MSSWLSSFARRCSPLLALRLAAADPRSIPATVDVCLKTLESDLQSTLSCLADAVPGVSFQHPLPDDVIKEAGRVLEDKLGFRLERRASRLSGGGRGVFVGSGSIAPGSFVCLYPGTIYEPWDPILLQSIGNHFILRCRDGVTVDGNDRRLSKFVHRSCAFRDLSPNVSDLSWLTDRPLSFLNQGQYINNSVDYNVQYVDLDLHDWPYRLRKFLPYSIYSASGRKDFRVVLLVSTRQIEAVEELYSSYISK